MLNLLHGENIEISQYSDKKCLFLSLVTFSRIIRNCRDILQLCLLIYNIFKSKLLPYFGLKFIVYQFYPEGPFPSLGIQGERPTMMGLKLQNSSQQPADLSQNKISP